MIRRLLFHFIFVFFLTTCSFATFAQIETIVTNVNEEMVDNSVKKIGDHLLYATKLSSYSKIWDVDLSTGIRSVLDTNIRKFDNFAYSDEGIFYTSVTSTGTWGYGEFYLNYMDSQGNQLPPVLIGLDNSSIPNNYDPRDATICNNHYYLHSLYGNDYCVWESNGTAAGTQIIYQSPDPIVNINEWKDTLFIVTKNSSEYRFFHYTTGGSIQQYAVQPTANFISDFQLIGENDDHFYFKSKDSLNYPHIHRINFQNPPDFFTNGHGTKIDFIGNRFILQHLWYDGGSVYSGLMSNPQQIEPVPTSSNLQSQSLVVDAYFGKGYFRVRSIENGIELAHLNTNDSLELIQTNVPGVGSGVPVNVDGFVHHNNWTTTKFFTDDVGNTYTVLTNGNDGSYYMYRINGSIEPIII